MSPAVSAPAPLGRLLIQKKRITEKQLELALLEQAKQTGERLGEILLRLGHVTEDDLVECLGEQYSLPVVKLNRFLVDHAIVDAFPQRFLEKNLICPMFKVGDTTTVAVGDPTNIFVQDEIRRLVGGKVQAVLATPTNIRDALRLKADLADAFGVNDIICSEEGEKIEFVEEAEAEVDDFDEQSGLSPAVRLVNFILTKAVNEGASDIHIELDEDQLRVRIRVDGLLHEALTPQRTIHSALVSRIKVMANLDISERRLPQDGRFRINLAKRPIDFRVSTLPCQYGEKVVIRILDKDAMLFDLETIGIQRDLLERFDREIRRPHGMILVTGPTGSGKSTTLYSALMRIKSPELNICTVENPVEFSLKGINQVQTNDKVGMTFSSALRSLLRQDPDVIMVGEIRDRDTAATAVQASLTGHLVFSTLHTNDAPSAVTRLANMDVEPYLIGASLNAVVAQRLIRKLCSECREPWKPAVGTSSRLKSLGFAVETLQIGKGCSKCRNTGYSGRIGIYELLCLDDSLRDLVVGGAPLTEIRNAAREQGMTSLFDDGLAKAREGITSADEVMRVTE